MVQPAVVITELDGQLGVLPPSSGALPAYVGASSAGTVNVPTTFGRVTDLVAAFGGGPAVEAAAYEIARYGRPVVFTKATASVAGTATAPVTTGGGTSVITRDAAVVPIDDFEFRIKFLTGGTIGVAGITFQWSLDDGRNFSPVTALGTANTWTAPAGAPPGSPAPGIKIDFGAGTILANQVTTFRTSAPNWSSADLTAALTALGSSILNWELAVICGPMDAAGFDAADLAIAGLAPTGRYRGFIAHGRVPTIGESSAAYKTALDTIFAVKATEHGMICAGAAKVSSAVSGRQYKRPSLFVIAASQCDADHEENIADVNRGSLKGVSIRDANGNPDEHDETVSPGLDDSRFAVLRTWDGIQGVYVNRPLMLSAAGSDFRLMPHRRVLNLAHAALRQYFLRRLNKPIRVNASTGFILEEEALEIEAGARAAMRSVLLAKPKASGIEFSLSRVDNILSTKTLNGTARVIPLAYPEFINLEVGFKNPALSVLAQAA